MSQVYTSHLSDNEVPKAVFNTLALKIVKNESTKEDKTDLTNMVIELTYPNEYCVFQSKKI